MALSIPIVSEFNGKGIDRAIKEFKQLEGAGAKAQFALKKAALPAIAALGALGLAAKSAVAAGEAAATANARIAQINDSMGLFGDSTKIVNERLIAYANATARATGVDQNSIKATQAKLLTFKELAQTADQVGGAFDRATAAAIDMAAAGFGEAEMNAVQLGKALNDPIKGITALAKSGVTFTEQEKDKIKTLVESNRTLEAQNLILAAIETQVGGTAEATANDSDKMKVAFSQVSESIGLILLPMFQQLSAILIQVADFATKNSKAIVIMSGVIATLAAGILIANFAMKAFAAAKLAMAAATFIATKAQLLFNLALSANPIGLAIIAIAAIIAVFVLLEKRLGIVSKAIKLFGDFVTSFVINPIKTAIGYVKDLIGLISKIPGVGAITGAVGGILGSLQNNTGGGSVSSPNIPTITSRAPSVVVPSNIRGGGNTTINVTGGISTSAEIGQSVLNSLLAYQRSNGPLDLQIA
jgi:hypothetical protein